MNDTLAVTPGGTLSRTRRLAIGSRTAPVAPDKGEFVGQRGRRCERCRRAR